MMIAEAIALYAEQHGPHAAAPERIAHAGSALLDWWGEATIAEITPQACRRYVEERKAQIATGKARRRRRAETRARRLGQSLPAAALNPPTDGTPRRELGVLRAALNWCVAHGHLAAAPHIVLPEKPPATERWLSRPEIGRLVRAARSAGPRAWYLPHFILLAFYTGARRSAILSLQWQPNGQGGHVDLGRGVIDFQGGARKTTKRRTLIPIPPKLQRILRILRRRTETFVFERVTRRPDGGPLRRPVADPGCALAAAGRRAGLGHVNPHLLKHTAITYLVQEGVPLWDVAAWTGTSEEMIRRVYGHHGPDRFERVWNAYRRPSMVGGGGEGAPHRGG